MFWRETILGRVSDAPLPPPKEKGLRFQELKEIIGSDRSIKNYMCKIVQHSQHIIEAIFLNPNPL